MALGVDGTFVARTVDTFVKPQRAILQAAHAHQGASFVEIWQNCNIFNDGAFLSHTDRKVRGQQTIEVEHGKPLVFGDKEVKYGLRLKGLGLEQFEIGGELTEADAVLHDETNPVLATLLARMGHHGHEHLPVALGVLYRVQRPRYEAGVHAQLEAAGKVAGSGDLQKALYGGNTWVVE